MVLYQAAQVMLVRSTKWSWRLKAWAMKIVGHRGMKKAIAARRGWQRSRHVEQKETPTWRSGLAEAGTVRHPMSENLATIHFYWHPISLKFYAMFQERIDTGSGSRRFRKGSGRPSPDIRPRLVAH
jgi:hypothetical protein